MSSHQDREEESVKGVGQLWPFGSHEMLKRNLTHFSFPPRAWVCVLDTLFTRKHSQFRQIFKFSFSYLSELPSLSTMEHCYPAHYSRMLGEFYFIFLFATISQEQRAEWGRDPLRL